MNNAGKNTGARWRVDGWHVVAENADQQRIYIRELIDWGSYEFEHCVFSYRERLEIIESAGEAAILDIMAQIAEEKGRPYSTGVQGKLDFDLLRRLSIK